MMSFIRSALSMCRKNMFSIRKRLKTTMGDPIDIATGIEKREMLAYQSGNYNPFDLYVLKRGPGTKDCPNEIPSAYEARIVGCMCTDEITDISYMVLEKGVPKRCACGHWFKLISKAPF